MQLTQEKEAINDLCNRFFDVFTNTNGRKPNIWALKEFFLPSGSLINNTTQPIAIYSLDSFITPREALLTNGTLLEFSEWETKHTTEIHETIAQRSCHYEKSGILNGAPYAGRGTKLLQFVKIDEKWWISSVVWKDEI